MISDHFNFNKLIKIKMIVVKAFKMIVFSFSMLPVAFSALSVGILFSSYNIAVSRNPEEKDGLFSTTMMAFALIESFVFIGILIAFLVFYGI